jgi:hypothetical protein
MHGQLIVELHIKISLNPSSGERFVPCGRTGELDTREVMFTFFRNRANEPKTVCEIAENNIKFS